MEDEAHATGVAFGKSDSIQKCLAIPEDVPYGWDADADWALRVVGREWWKQQRDASKILSYATTEERFFEAARVGAVPWVREMLAGEGRWGGKVDVMARDARLSNWTALHHAAQRGNYETAKVLLEAGADPRAEDTEWRGTPLHTAAAYGRSQMCRLLVEAGADVNARDWGNDTAVDEAVRFKRQETAVVLMSLGGNSSRLANEEAEQKAVWITDPLWPDKYNKDLLADSSVTDDRGDEDDSNNASTSELERQVWWYSDNKTFAEQLVEMTDAIPDDKWVEQPPHDPIAIKDFPGMTEEMAVEEASDGIDPDTSSGWGELAKLRIPDKQEGDETSSELPATVFKGEAPVGVAGVPVASAGVMMGDTEVSTCEESDLNAARVTGRNREKKPKDPEGGSDSEEPSVSWSSSG